MTSGLSSFIFILSLPTIARSRRAKNGPFLVEGSHRDQFFLSPKSCACACELASGLNHSCPVVSAPWQAWPRLGALCDSCSGQPLLWHTNHPCRGVAAGHFVVKLGEFNNTAESFSVPSALGLSKHSQAHFNPQADMGTAPTCALQA